MIWAALLEKKRRVQYRENHELLFVFERRGMKGNHDQDLCRLPQIFCRHFFIMPEELKQWVHEVTNFSSQYANEERISFSVNNLPGVPNVYPHHGESVEAFELRSYGAWDRQSPSFLSSYLNEPWASKVSRTVTDFVDVKLRVPVIPSSIEIFETYNPGAVSAIWAFRWANNSWTSLWASNGVPGDTESHKSGTSRIFSPQLRKIPFKTDLLRFEFNTSYSPHHVQIDAIRVISNPGVMVDPVVEERNVDHTSELRRKVAELNLRCDPADLLAVFSKFMEQEYADFVKHFQSRLNGLEWLPDYVIMKILGYLDLKSLCALSRVNRHLYRLSSDPLLYRKLDMRPYWPQLRGKCLFKYLSSKCSVLRMLDLSWCGCYGAITANEFCKIMDRFGHTLLGLWLDYCDFLTSDVIKMLHIWCPQLKELSLCGLQLKGDPAQSGFLSLRGLRNLERLNLYRTNISEDALIMVLDSSPNLRHLLVGSCWSVESMDRVAAVVPVFCPRIESLDLWRAPGFTVAGLTSISKCSMLRELVLGWTISEDSSFHAAFRLFCCGVPNLQKIDLSAFRILCDADVDHMSRCCPELMQVILMGNRTVTVSSVKRLLVACRSLRLLDVGYCNVSRYEVEELRAQYPNATIICD